MRSFDLDSVVRTDEVDEFLEYVLKVCVELVRRFLIGWVHPFLDELYEFYAGASVRVLFAVVGPDLTVDAETHRLFELYNLSLCNRVRFHEG